MDSSLACPPIDAACSIAGRLSFSQILLVTTYMFLRSCLPFRTGDDRQILDILRREEKDWQPRIGSERLSELMTRNHEVRDPRMGRIWKEIRSLLIRDHSCLRVSTRDLREHLRYILNKLQQISAEGLNAIEAQAHRLPPPKVSLPSSGTVALICMSLSVAPGGTPQTIYWEQEDSKMEDMVHHLNKSPLFPDGIDVNELSTTLSSLELLFSCEDDRVNLFQSGADLNDGVKNGTEKREMHTRSYESYQVLQRCNSESNIREGSKLYPGEWTLSVSKKA